MAARPPEPPPAGTHLGSAARRPHTDGAFARRVALPGRMLHPLPTGPGLRTAALAEPAAVAWHGVERAGDVRGRRVLGAGPIGLLAVAVAGHHGAADLHEHPLDVARHLGATTIPAGDADAIAAVHADVVIDSSGSPRGPHSAVRGAVRGGTVVMVGLPPSGEQPVPASLAITGELPLVGSFRFDRELDPVLAARADGCLDAAPAVTRVLPVERALETFELALDASRSSKVPIDFRGGDVDSQP